jgi:hypothetical protein
MDADELAEAEQPEKPQPLRRGIDTGMHYVFCGGRVVIGGCLLARYGRFLFFGARERRSRWPALVARGEAQGAIFLLAPPQDPTGRR